MHHRKEYPNQEEVRSLFDYRDGKLYAKFTSSHHIGAGEEVGHVYDGRVKIHLNHRPHLYRSNLVWIWHNGSIQPRMIIDHWDRDTQNDRIENLREITQSRNMLNAKQRYNSNAIIPGVTFSKDKWIVMFCGFYLGRFDSLLEAICVRKSAELRLNSNE